MEIYLIRHGETDYNLQGIVQGSSVNTDLNATGVSQAEKFYSTYKEVAFDKIYTSTLNRAIQSVQKFIDKGIDWETTEGLNEINWGNSDGQKVNVKEHQEYLNTLKKWQEGQYDVRMPGGESPLDVLERQKEIKNILSNSEHKKVLICMHGRAMRVFLCNMLNLELSNMEEFIHSNLCLYVLRKSPLGFEIVKSNDTAHLA